MCLSHHWMTSSIQSAAISPSGLAIFVGEMTTTPWLATWFSTMSYRMEGIRPERRMGLRSIEMSKNISLRKVDHISKSHSNLSGQDHIGCRNNERTFQKSLTLRSKILATLSRTCKTTGEIQDWELPRGVGSVHHQVVVQPQVGEPGQLDPAGRIRTRTEHICALRGRQGSRQGQGQGSYDRIELHHSEWKGSPIDSPLASGARPLKYLDVMVRFGRW